MSCYRPPDSRVDKESWKRFFLQFHNTRHLVTGDFSAHHSSWGDRRDCVTGRNIVEAIDDLDINILNSGSATFLSNQYRSESAIDLSFVDTTSLLQCSWEIDNDTWGSDHYPIHIKYNEQIDTSNEVRRSPRLY